MPYNTKVMNQFMKLPVKYIAAGICGFAIMIGWNVFLIQRDNVMFDNASTIKERFCAAQAKWHPDCNVE